MIKFILFFIGGVPLLLVGMEILFAYIEHRIND